MKNSMFDALNAPALRLKHESSYSLISKLILSNSRHREVILINPSWDEVIIAEESLM